MGRSSLRAGERERPRPKLRGIWALIRLNSVEKWMAWIKTSGGKEEKEEMGGDRYRNVRATSALDHLSPSTSTIPSECVFIFYYILSSKVLILLAK